jgi:hypothetical protein
MMNLEPFCFVSISSFDNTFSGGTVSSFYDSISAGVIGRDPDVVDSVFFCEVVESFDKGSSVVRDDFFECSPTT